MKIVDRIFFSKTFVRNRSGLNQKGPLIAVSNHPNTLLDPLNVAERINRFVFFLANASMFAHPFTKWLFDRLYCIPVERPKDVNGRKIQNDASFKKVDEFLTSGGCLYIAPEGVSDIERRLRPLKTGTARMALSAENKNDFNLGLEILPVGLNYSDQTAFRSQLFINVGKPIKVSDFKKTYLEDNFKAAKQLTTALEKRMRTLVIDTKDDTEDQLIRKMETILQTKNSLSFDLKFDRTQRLIDGWRGFQNENPRKSQNLSNQINNYFYFLQKNKISDKVIVQAVQNNFLTKWWGRTLFMILGFYIFIYGWINNFLANFFPAALNKKMGLYIGYSSTVKCMSALLTYPIFYGLQMKLVAIYIGGGWIPWAYLVTVVVAGLFAWWYKDFAMDTLKGWRARRIRSQNKNQVAEMMEMRKSISEELNQLLSLKGKKVGIN